MKRIDSDLRLSRNKDYEPIEEEEEEVLNLNYAHGINGSIEVVTVVGTRKYHEDPDYLGPIMHKPTKVQILKADDRLTRKPRAYIKPNSYGSADESGSQDELRSRSLRERARPTNMYCKLDLSARFF